MKNSNDTIGNRTRDLPACGAVPQPATLRVSLQLTVLGGLSNLQVTKVSVHPLRADKMWRNGLQSQKLAT